MQQNWWNIYPLDPFFCPHQNCPIHGNLCQILYYKQFLELLLHLVILNKPTKALLSGKFLQRSNQELILYPTSSISSYSIFFLKIPLVYLKFRLTKLDINILIQNHTCTLGSSDVLDTKETEHDKFLNKDHPVQICPWLLNKSQLSPLFFLHVTYKIVIAAFHISLIFVF